MLRYRPLAERVSHALPNDRSLCLDERRDGDHQLHAVGNICELSCAQPSRCPATGRVRVMPMHELIRSVVPRETTHHIVLVTRGLVDVGKIDGGAFSAMLREFDHIEGGAFP